MAPEENTLLSETRRRHPEKFQPVSDVFRRIHRGDRIFIGSGCAEPQYLVNALIRYAEQHPKAVVDAEVLHIWSLGVAPYADLKFRDVFRQNSFFVSSGTRDAVNAGLADYTPIFLSQVPQLFREGRIPLDVALIQVSPPDEHGYVSLGIGVDIVKEAVQTASTVVAQVNSNMPRVHGESFIHVDQIAYLVPWDEPLLEIVEEVDTSITSRIGKYIARLIQDGDTLQVGYGSIPNAVLANLEDKQHLGIHSELLTDGIMDLMELGVVDNSRKTHNRHKTVISFCMGKRETYRRLHNHPAVEFRPIDYTNDARLIARQANMTAINTALAIDLTGQVTAESIGGAFFSAVGGQADFMRGAVLAPGGKSIIALPSTAGEHNEISRIVSTLPAGAGVTLHRGDVHYVVTEYGIGYLHGRNVRERAMELISIAHPKFRASLIEEAKKNNFIYRDQAFVPGRKGEYPEELERYRGLSGGNEILLRPVRMRDEPLLKEFFYSLSDRSLYRRFLSVRFDMPHARLQEFCVIDYSTEMVILATEGTAGHEHLLGIGQYGIDPGTHTAEIAVVVRDNYQNRGIGTELVAYLTQLARRAGLLGFTAEVLVENTAMIRLFEKMGFEIESHSDGNVYQLRLSFRKIES